MRTTLRHVRKLPALLALSLLLLELVWLYRVHSHNLREAHRADEMVGAAALHHATPSEVMLRRLAIEKEQYLSMTYDHETVERLLGAPAYSLEFGMISLWSACLVSLLVCMSVRHILAPRTRSAAALCTVVAVLLVSHAVCFTVECACLGSDLWLAAQWNATFFMLLFGVCTAYVGWLSSSSASDSVAGTLSWLGRNVLFLALLFAACTWIKMEASPLQGFTLGDLDQRFFSGSFSQNLSALLLCGVWHGVGQGLRYAFSGIFKNMMAKEPSAEMRLT